MNAYNKRPGGCFICGTSKLTVGMGDPKRRSRPSIKTMTIDGNAGKNKNLCVQANLAGTADADDKEIVQCYVCHQRGDHDSNACPNGDVLITIKNDKFRAYGKKNAQDDARGPLKKLWVA